MRNYAVYAVNWVLNFFVCISAVYRLECADCSVQYADCKLKCTVCRFQCAECSVQCADKISTDCRLACADYRLRQCSMQIEYWRVQIADCKSDCVSTDCILKCADFGVQIADWRLRQYILQIEVCRLHSCAHRNCSSCVHVRSHVGSDTHFQPFVISRMLSDR